MPRNSLDHSSTGTPSRIARKRAIALRQFADIRFQVLFHSPPGVLFAFPSRYSSTIGHHRVFSLGGWAPRIRSGFHVSRPTWDPARPETDFGYGAFTPCGRPFQTFPLSASHATSRSRNPGKQACRFRLLRVRSPLLAQSRLMSSPAGTEMFHFPASRSGRPMCSAAGDGALPPPDCSIRKSPDHSVLATPRSLSQLAASFIA